MAEGKLPQERITAEGQEIVYQIDRGKRKHYYICVAHGQVTVKIPWRGDREFARRMVLEKSQWILSKLRQQEKEKQPELAAGETIFLAGEPYRLAVETGTGKKPEISYGKGNLQVKLPGNMLTSKETLQNVLEDYYRIFTQKMVEDSFQRISEQTGLFPDKIAVKKLRSSWGRCSSNGHISISLYLGAYSQKVVDYVVLHELCHLRHMNHSAAFWQEVERWMPDWKQRRRELEKRQSIKPA